MNYKSRLFEFIGLAVLDLKVNVYINMKFRVKKMKRIVIQSVAHRFIVHLSSIENSSFPFH
jgi:hypothetical protein